MEKYNVSIYHQIMYR